jgi:hypothetical protein
MTEIITNNMEYGSETGKIGGPGPFAGGRNLCENGILVASVYPD